MVNNKLYTAITPQLKSSLDFKTEFVIKFLDAIIWEYDLKGNRFSSDNPNSILRKGKNFEEYIAIHHPEDRAMLRKAFEELIRGTIDRMLLEVRLQQSDNSYIWIRIHGAVFERSEDGSAERIIGLRRDIQTEMEAQIELIESKRKLEEYAINASLSLHSGDVFIWNYDVTTEMFSSHLKTSYMYDGVSKNDFIESVHVDDRALVVEGLQKFLIHNSTEPYTCKIRVNSPGKGTRWFDLTATVLYRDADGNPLVLTGLKRDITHEYAIIDELVILRNKADEANRLKTAFFANMSHEIRTPLNAILGFSNLIVESSDDESLAEYAKMITTNSELLTQLINDVLDLSRIEAGKLDFNMSEICLDELLEQCRQMFQIRALSGVKIVYDKPADRCRIFSEQNRLTQVISNFLSNAIKYTREGSIHFGYLRQPSGLYFYVTDTGKGIAEEDIPQVFERFIKFDHSVQGTGLGLSICKMIVDKLGGNIGVYSEVGKGSKFWFTLPCQVDNCL